MTLTTTASRVQYPGAGSVGPFAIPFRFLAATDLLVTKRTNATGAEALLANGTHYTVTGAGNATGALTLVTALAAGETLSIRRVPALTQPTSIRNQSSYYPATHEDAFDRLVMQMQSLEDGLARALKIDESHDPSLYDLKIPPGETGKALVWQSATQLGSATLDASAVALPGAGRTVPTLSAYLLNNAVFNVADYADINGVIGDDAFQDAIAAANAVVGAETALKSQVGAVVKVPPGTFLVTQRWNPYPGVTIEGSGLWSTVVMFSMANTEDAIVWDRSVAGYAMYQGFGWGGSLRDIKITTVDFTTANQTCNAMVKVLGLVDFALENVMLAQGHGRLLHLESILSVSMKHVSLQQNNTDCGCWIGSPGSIATTVNAFHVYQSQCKNGPGFDVGGLAFNFHGLICESNGSGGTQAGSYGFKVRFGTVSLYGPYFEDNADHDMYIGSEASAQLTTFYVNNPICLTGPNSLPGKAGIHLNIGDHAVIQGGGMVSRTNTVEIHPTNWGFVDLTTFVTGTLKEPVLTTGAHWRTKTNLNYRKDAGLAQTLTKAGIAPAGTAVLTIPVLANQPAFLRVYAMVQFDSGANLQATAEIVVSHEIDGFAGGGAVVRLLHNDSAGNFLVAAGDFVATFGAGTIVITYTCGNPATNNTIRFYVEGVNVAGDITLA